MDGSSSWIRLYRNWELGHNPSAMVLLYDLRKNKEEAVFCMQLEISYIYLFCGEYFVCVKYEEGGELVLVYKIVGNEVIEIFNWKSLVPYASIWKNEVSFSVFLFFTFYFFSCCFVRREKSCK